jgi:hypothetical protein
MAAAVHCWHFVWHTEGMMVQRPHKIAAAAIRTGSIMGVMSQHKHFVVHVAFLLTFFLATTYLDLKVCINDDLQVIGCDD